jgi:hypothetical protein
MLTALGGGGGGGGGAGCGLLVPGGNHCTALILSLDRLVGTQGTAWALSLCAARLAGAAAAAAAGLSSSAVQALVSLLGLRMGQPVILRGNDKAYCFCLELSNNLQAAGMQIMLWTTAMGSAPQVVSSRPVCCQQAVRPGRTLAVLPLQQMLHELEQLGLHLGQPRRVPPGQPGHVQADCTARPLSENAGTDDAATSLK